jgi:hypothetical protein
MPHCILEYTIKNSRNSTKQTFQFHLKDVTFFQHDRTGHLRQVNRFAPTEDITSANSATLKLESQKNGWKGVCIHQETNGHPTQCPARALGQRYLHIRKQTASLDVFLSPFFHNAQRFDVTDNDIQNSLKRAASTLQYPSRNSLRSGGADALSLSGYSDREIQKMGRWRSANFKEYIREELACFSAGMSTKMKTKFNFVNIAGGVYTDVTNNIMLP